MSTALQYVATSALSLTLSGNTGVAPFLTLLLVGIVERSNPTLLYMEGWIEKLLSSWPSIAIFSVLTVLEFVGKCVPCVDAMIDSAMTFVVPILSVFGSLASFGLFTAGQQPVAADPAGGGIPINMTDVLFQDEEVRLLQEPTSDEKSGWLIFLQVMLCLVGIGLALLVHLFKLLIRVLGEGCCTCCITSVEYSWVAGSVLLTIFIVPIAIGTAIVLMGAAAYVFKRKVWDKRKEEQEEGGSNSDGNANGAEHEENEAKDEEDGAGTDTGGQELTKEGEVRKSEENDVAIAVAVPDGQSENVPDAEVHVHVPVEKV